MAEIQNKNNDKLATDEAGMMEDAKAYAKREFYIIKQYEEKKKGSPLTMEEEEACAKTFIEAKFDAIKASRHGVNRLFA